MFTEPLSLSSPLLRSPLGFMESGRIPVHPMCWNSSQSRCPYNSGQVRELGHLDTRAGAHPLLFSSEFIITALTFTSYRVKVASLQHMGNSRARAVYEAQLPDGFRRPQTDAALESFIRAKYEQKKYVAKEWVPSPAPKVNIGWTWFYC